MFKKIFSRFIRRRHYWRDIGFDQLTELYTSMMFRSLAMGLAGIFVPIYLYQNGTPVWEILFFYTIMFTTYTLAVILGAFLIARIGPKHTIFVSSLFQAASMGGLIILHKYDIPLHFIAMSFGIANALFYSSFHVDFSKVKHSLHAGKEVGWMYIMQKVGATLGPILGGVIAFLFGSQYIFVVAFVLLCVGMVPLLISREPVRTRQKLDYKNLKIKDIKYDLMPYSAFALENTISVVVWPLFIGVLVFQDNPYVQMGGVVSISIIASLLIARGIGSLIDKKHGRNLLRFGATSNAVLHLFRPFTNGFSSVLAVNLVNEATTVAYNMPFTKGFYDAADELPGHRIVYITTLEAIGGFTRTIFYAGATLIAFSYGDSRNFFFGLFAVGAIASLIIMKERFIALKA